MSQIREILDSTIRLKYDRYEMGYEIVGIEKAESQIQKLIADEKLALLNALLIEDSHGFNLCVSIENRISNLKKEINEDKNRNRST